MNITTVQAPPSPRRSFRKSTSSDTSYRMVVDFDGYKVYCNPFPPEALRALASIETGVQSATKLAEDERKAAEEVAKSLPAEEKAAAVAEAGEAYDKSVTQALEAREKGYYGVLHRPRIVGWEFPDDDGQLLPCTNGTIDDLPFDVVFNLALQIRTKQTLGGTKADFLALQS